MKQPARRRQLALRTFALGLKKEGVSSLDILVLSSGLAAELTNNDIDAYMELMDAVFGHDDNGLSSLFPPRVSGVGDFSTQNEFNSTGFRSNYKDPDPGNDQVHHFWFAVQSTYFQGPIVEGFGNIYHETANSGRSFQDFDLSVQGIGLGAALRSGAITPMNVAGWLLEALAE